MGNSTTRESGESKSINPNGKSLELLCEMCSSWGYKNTKNQVLSVLVKNLNDKGYDVSYNLEPMAGGNGEFFIYKIENGTKNIIFSNNKKKHGSNDVVIGGKITANNVDEITKKIIG